MVDQFITIDSDTNELPAVVEQRIGGIADAKAAAVSNVAAAAKSMAVKGFAPKTQASAFPIAFIGAAGHGWASGSSGSPAPTFDLNDTSDYAQGDRCLKMVTGGGAGSAFAWVAKTNIPAFDLTGRYLRVWVKMSDLTRVKTLQFIVGNDAFTSYFSFLVRSYSGAGGASAEELSSPIKSGQWEAVDLPWSLAIATGTPSRSALTAIRLIAYDNGVPTEIKLGGVAAVDERNTYPNGVVSLTFDDTYDSTLAIAKPIMDKYGYAGTLYPIQAEFGNAGRLTLAQAAEMRRVNGWDFGFHATTTAVHDAGFHGMGEAALAAEFEAQRAWATENGVVGDSFAWPLGYSDAVSVRVASRYFRTARGVQPMPGSLTTGGPETVPPSVPYHLRSLSIRQPVTLANVTGFIDRVKAGKGWGVLTFHRIMPSGNTGNDTTTAIFQGICDYLNAQGVAVRTVGQVMDVM